MRKIRKKFTWRLLLKNMGISILMVAGMVIWGWKWGLEDYYLLSVVVYISMIIGLTVLLTIAQTVTTNYFIGQFVGLVLAIVFIIVWLIAYVICFKIFGINIFEIYFDLDRMKFIIKPH
ncbi:hypothetical protein BBF96_08945 [Anoxybacter fermentans]|uniref:Uncharacterized protein n=1 Tax=Anoxybacter fermentans TaxID=1323375 RepID=A0A3S9SZ12_9FIRM|nr:hypothetical protein [Anoxybacter fermentans]AZR73500.1 hypothetical protein BBF96_08945 [Anoxybacter fermentans]